jgi:Saf4/Yju2 protein
MKVRMMLPMTVRCQTCGEFMYKGTKFNCKKEDVVGETYLGIQIFRFYMRCRKCSAEITYLTDPQNLDYKMEHGATRNFEQWKQEQTIEEALKQRRDTEDEDKVKKLENKTADAKREMDMMGVLDDMLHTKGQHAAVSTDEAIAALRARADAEAAAAGVQNGELTPADEAALEAMVAAGRFTRRIEDDDEWGEGASGAGATAAGTKRIAPAAPRRPGKVKVHKAVARVAPAANGADAQNGAAADTGPSGQAEAAAAMAGDAVRPVAAAAGQDNTKGAQAVTKTAAPQGLGLGGYGGSSSSEGSVGGAGS